MVGKRRRLRRILKNGKTFIIPIDHGVTKPEQGIEDIDRLLLQIEGCVDAVVLHKGIVMHSEIVDELDAGLIVHLSGSTSLSRDPNDKRIVCSVENALRLGADAVSVHVNLSSETEARQIEEFGKISDECEMYGLPLIAMVYPRGKVEVNAETVKHAARLAYELGADIVKVPFVDRFEEVVKFCKIPVIVAGGSKESEEELYKKIRTAVASGAAGAAVGRNVFCSDDPRRVAATIYSMIHGVEVNL